MPGIALGTSRCRLPDPRQPRRLLTCPHVQTRKQSPASLATASGRPGSALQLDSHGARVSKVTVQHPHGQGTGASILTASQSPGRQHCSLHPVIPENLHLPGHTPPALGGCVCVHSTRAPCAGRALGLSSGHAVSKTDRPSGFPPSPPAQIWTRAQTFKSVQAPALSASPGATGAASLGSEEGSLETVLHPLPPSPLTVPPISLLAPTASLFCVHCSVPHLLQL